MVASVSSAFWARLQQEDIGTLVELISLEGRGFRELYTTSNQELFATLSGTLREYRPFPGAAAGRVRSTTDLTISTIDFIMANSAAGNLQTLMNANQLDYASVVIERVFADTPDLGRLPVFRGNIGDVSYTRRGAKGQVRNEFDSANVNFPYHSYGDGCAWRFGSTGCGFNTASVTITISTGFIVVASCTRIGFYVNSNVNQKEPNYYDFGRVVMITGNNSGQVRTIRDHNGAGFLLSHALPFAISSEDSFTVYPGCRKRRIADCTSKYNNTDNFLGFWTTPIPEQISVGE